MLPHKTIDIYNKSKTNQLNNVHYFLYSKIIWEECMVNLLRAHGKHVMIGSDSQDINGIDMLAESKEMPGMYYPIDAKLMVKSNSSDVTQKCKSCIALNEYCIKSCSEPKADNSYILFVDEYLGVLFIIKKSDIAKCPYHNCWRGSMWAYEILVSDMLQYTHSIDLTVQEQNIVKTYRKTLNSLLGGQGITKTGFEYNYTNEQRLEILNKAVHDLGLDKYYNIHFNFK